MSARFVALVAGIFFFFLAVVTQGILPFIEPSARTTNVTAVVRTDFGQLKWLLTGATDYTPQQKLGRQVYLREGCWYCHSQYVRPVTGETRRWGPVSEAGEYAFDVPHLWGTRRIGRFESLCWISCARLLPFLWPSLRTSPNSPSRARMFSIRRATLRWYASRTGFLPRVFLDCW